MRLKRKGLKLLALFLGLSLVAAACGAMTTAAEDYRRKHRRHREVRRRRARRRRHVRRRSAGAHRPGAQHHARRLPGHQRLYDGLTDIDASDPDNPEIVPLLAESFEPNEDATVWTFTIREGQQFSDGEAILPSTFQRSWERASDPDFAGDYSYLFNFIEGGAEKLAGEPTRSPASWPTTRR